MRRTVLRVVAQLGQDRGRWILLDRFGPRAARIFPPPRQVLPAGPLPAASNRAAPTP